jgi:hypothetical protein
MSGRILLSFVDFIPVSSEVERVRRALVKSLLVRNWWCGGRNHRPLTRLSFLSQRVNLANWLMIDWNENAIFQLRLLGRTCDPARWLRTADLQVTLWISVE